MAADLLKGNIANTPDDFLKKLTDSLFYEKRIDAYIHTTDKETGNDSIFRVSMGFGDKHPTVTEVNSASSYQHTPEIYLNSIDEREKLIKKVEQLKPIIATPTHMGGKRRKRRSSKSKKKSKSRSSKSKRKSKSRSSKSKRKSKSRSSKRKRR